MKKVLEKPNDVENGSFADVYSIAQLQKLSSDNNVKDEKNKELFHSLILEKYEIDEEYGENTIYLLSWNPFQISWSSPLYPP